jgi:hypothetical protein
LRYAEKLNGPQAVNNKVAINRMNKKKYFIKIRLKKPNNFNKYKKSTKAIKNTF